MNAGEDRYARYDSGVSSDFWEDAPQPLLVRRTAVALAVVQLCGEEQTK